MQTSDKMYEIINRIADAHQFDLTAPYGHLSLSPVYNQPLVIEKHGKDTLAVMHIPSDGIGLDPMIRFHVSSIGRWFPIAEHMSLFGRTKVLAELQGEGEWAVMPISQKHTAKFGNQWARNIRSQKWIDQPSTVQFSIPTNTAMLILPDGTATPQTPANLEDGFGLKALYAMLDCDTVEVVYGDDPNTIMIIDEEGKYSGAAVNPIATRLFRIDEHRDEIVGNALICPSEWFK